MRDVKFKEMNRECNYENIKYGILVELLYPNSSNYHTGMKVHFFNQKGVLVGNVYEFLPYSRIRFRKEKERYYPRYFMQEKAERVRQFLFEKLCDIVTYLIKYTQKSMHKI